MSESSLHLLHGLWSTHPVEPEGVGLRLAIDETVILMTPLFIIPIENT